MVDIGREYVAEEPMGPRGELGAYPIPKSARRAFGASSVIGIKVEGRWVSGWLPHGHPDDPDGESRLPKPPHQNSSG